MESVIRLPLDNAYNVRELGGYSCMNRNTTKWKRFLRADDISALSQNDIAYLKAYGVNTVIDLRSQKETEANPDALVDVEGIAYHHIPFMKGDVDDVTKIAVDFERFDLGDFYVGLLEEKSKVAQLIKQIVQAPPGCILFHCSAGKDRTGVLSMLLLLIAGVSKADVEANYELTYTYLQHKPGFLDMIPEHFDPSCMYSKPEFIRKAIDHIHNGYTSIENYLHTCGVSAEMIQQTKRRLLANE